MRLMISFVLEINICSFTKRLKHYCNQQGMFKLRLQSLSEAVTGGVL